MPIYFLTVHDLEVKQPDDRLAMEVSNLHRIDLRGPGTEPESSISTVRRGVNETEVLEKTLRDPGNFLVFMELHVKEI